MNVYGSHVFLVTAIVACFAGVASPTRGDDKRDQLDIEFLYDELAPYGEWVPINEYGWVWTPHNVPPGWRPYTVGNWTFTNDHGWFWVSDWDWGWAPFHYGRWVLDDRHGWAWVPGTEWGPAWVAWRSGGGHVGWAPLPPAVEWSVDAGLNLNGLDLSISIHPSHWSFAEEQFILSPHVYEHCIHPTRNITLLHSTTNATHYTVVKGRIVNAGLSVEHIERTLGHPIVRLHVDVHALSTSTRRVEIKGSRINVFKPMMVRRTTKRTPRSDAIHRNTHSSHAPSPATSSRRSIKAHYKSKDSRGHSKEVRRRWKFQNRDDDEGHKEHKRKEGKRRRKHGHE